MKEIKVSIKLKDIPDEDLNLLATALGLDPKKTKDEDGIAVIAEAAVKEYLAMFIGKRVFSRGSDIQEFRLFLLIRNTFGDKIPSLERICALFQCTPSQARSLLRAVMSKYQYELRAAVETTVRNAVAAITPEKGGKFFVVLKNNNIVDELNKRLAKIHGAQDAIVREPGKLACYEIREAAYLALCSEFNITPKPKIK